MKSLLDKMPTFKNKPRWECIDDSRFLLLISGMITQSESDKIQTRLFKQAKKEKISLKEQSPITK
jgi:hypothetical protein